MFQTILSTSSKVKHPLERECGEDGLLFAMKFASVCLKRKKPLWEVD